MRSQALTNPLFNQLIKMANVVMDLLAGNDKEVTGPTYKR